MVPGHSCCWTLPFTEVLQLKMQGEVGLSACTDDALADLVSRSETLEGMFLDLSSGGRYSSLDVVTYPSVLEAMKTNFTLKTPREPTQLCCQFRPERGICYSNEFLFDAASYGCFVSSVDDSSI